MLLGCPGRYSERRNTAALYEFIVIQVKLIVYFVVVVVVVVVVVAVYSPHYSRGFTGNKLTEGNGEN